MGSVDFRFARRSSIFCPSRRRSVVHSSRSRSGSRSIWRHDSKQDYNQAETLRMITEAMGRCLREEHQDKTLDEALRGSAVLDEDVLERLADVVAKSLRLWEATDPRYRDCGCAADAEHFRGRW